MLKEIQLESKWQRHMYDQPIVEKADIIALYRFVYILGEELIEVESSFFYDEVFMADAMFNEAKKLELVQNKKDLQISILYFYIAESFIENNRITKTGKLLDTAYSLASKNYISPIQSIRSIDIKFIDLISLVSTKKEIRRLIREIDGKRAYDLLLQGFEEPD